MKTPAKVTKNVRAHFEEMVDELESNSNIEIVELEFGDPAPDELIQQAQALAGAPLPWELRSLYREMNGFRLRWVLRNSEELSEELEIEVPEDHMTILLPLLPEDDRQSRIHPQGVFSNWKGHLWREEDDPLRLARPIDYFVEEACTLLYPFPGKNPTIHLYNFGGVPYDTGRSFGQYLALLLQSHGFWYWPAALTEETQDREEVEAFRIAMPILFGDFDEELFQPPDL